MLLPVTKFILSPQIDVKQDVFTAINRKKMPYILVQAFKARCSRRQILGFPDNFNDFYNDFNTC